MRLLDAHCHVFEYLSSYRGEGEIRAIGGGKARWANGQVFLADVRSFGPMPDFEMAQIAHFETYPEKMRFPSILPELYRETIKRLENQL